MRRIFPMAALGLVLAAGAAPAQYFGQNKVQYRTFDFKIIQTEHFEVYYYDQERTAALDAARMVERAYARLSRVLHHQFQGRKPLILYASHTDFQQTNAISGDLGEGTGGVTEFFKHRMVIPFTGSYSDMEEVIQHELVHAFQYDVYSRGRIGAGIQTLINVNPPGWFMEGMAAYLSRGGIDPETAMWLRDASLEGNLPTIEQLTYDPRVFPYRYGQSLWAYIGEKWGDEVIGEILQTSATSGIEGAFKRALGLSLDDLSDEWRDAVQTTFLPQLSDHYRARRIAQPALNQRRSGGTVHLAPALSPDGREIAFFSERNTFSINLYVADVETGRIKRELAKSGFSTNFESLRFINSAGSWSPDGRLFAIAVKRKDRDDLVLIDMKRGREARRIQIPLNGLTTPNWSPDGKQIVFTGSDGGLSDLFLVNSDGTDLRRLTNDKYADFHPAWSPDGKTIAFSTDRGGITDFDQLRFGNMRVALYHLDTGSIEILDQMETGKNINPTWAPDGRSLAFVSDRTGISNIFLYDLGSKNVYQLTNLYTGASGITWLSPTLSWAARSDRLAFAYYENGDFNIYTLENPRSLRREIYRAPAAGTVVTSLLTVPRRDTAAAALTTPAPPAQPAQPGEAASVYRTPSGFRASGSPQPAETTSTAGPVSVRTLLDSATLSLPDTTSFAFRRYRTRFTPDYVARPTVGYQRDNFGRGFFGGTAISLSDILGNRTMVFAGSVNGRISEAQFLGVYVNQSRRMNWAAGFSQQPYYFYAPSTVTVQDDPRSSNPADSQIVFTARLRRLVVRDLFAEAYYPFSRFSRVELGVHAVNVGDATLMLSDCYENDASGTYCGSALDDSTGPGLNFIRPSFALVHDKTMFGYVGPFAGTRSRFEVSPSIGDWQYVSGLGDYRRYLFARPFTLAVRTLFFGRFGRDANAFPLFLGNTELIRGYTAGSFRDNECIASALSTSRTGCAELDQLIGSKVAVANIELRFPLVRNFAFGFLPVGLPPIEGALFYDAGLAWDDGSTVKWSRSSTDNPDAVRAPLRSYGASIRANMMGFIILRFDYTKPLDRPRDRSYWTISLGPTF